MSPNVHHCGLPPKHTAGLTRIAPNASWSTRVYTSFREFFQLDPNNNECKIFFRNKAFIVAEQRRYARSPYFVIHPFSKLASFLDTSFFVIWVYNIMLFPLKFEGNKAPPNVKYINDYFVFPVQQMLIASVFFLGYVDDASRQIVINPKTIIYRYLKTYFVFDVIASRTVKVLMRLFIKPLFSEKDLFYRLDVGVTIVEMFCYAIRMETLLKYLNEIGRHLNLRREIRFAVSHITKAYMFIHMLGCLLYFVPKLVYVDDWPRDSWLVLAKIDPRSDNTLIFIYSECILLATCHFLGASHGLYEIIQPVEEICLSVVTLFGRLYTLFLLADVLMMFGIASVSESRYEQRLSQLVEYMTSKKLPQQLRNRLLKYYEYKLQKRYFNEREMLSTLSDHLRTELFLFTARKLIDKASVFKVLPRTILGVMIASMKNETYAPRDVIYPIGAIVEDVYFIASGTVAVLNKDGVELCHLEDGDEFGVTTHLTDNIQRYKHVAVETTEVFYINKTIFLDFLQGHAESMKTFQGTVRKRLTRYEFIEEQAKKGGLGLMAELNRGDVVEHLTKRMRIEE